MNTAAPKTNKRHASPSRDVAMKRANVAVVSEADTPTVTLPVEVLQQLSMSVDAVARGLMNLPYPYPAVRGRFVAMLAQIQTRINGTIGVKKRVSVTDHLSTRQL